MKDWNKAMIMRHLWQYARRLIFMGFNCLHMINHHYILERGDTSLLLVDYEKNSNLKVLGHRP